MAESVIDWARACLELWRSFGNMARVARAMNLPSQSYLSKVKREEVKRVRKHERSLIKALYESTFGVDLPIVGQQEMESPQNRGRHAGLFETATRRQYEGY